MPRQQDLPPNFNVYPLSGLTSGGNNRADGVDPSEILNFLFKKSFNIPNAAPYQNYGYDSIYYNASIHLNSRNVYSQYIPPSIPVSLGRYPIGYTLNPITDLILDTTYPNGDGQKFIHPTYPYLAYYYSMLMTAAEANDYTFFVGTNNPPRINLTQNVIPLNYGDGVSYNYNLNSYDNSTTLFFGNSNFGSWLLDTDSGVLTFYDNVNQAIVNAGNPPRISFWRYEGLTGNSGISEVYEIA